MKKLLILFVFIAYVLLSREYKEGVLTGGGIEHPWPTSQVFQYAYLFSVKAEIVEISPGDA